MPPFTSTLSLGSYGPQVRALQEFLNSHGSPVANPGQPGGSGMETENFGQATLAALQKYQAANGIVSSGTPQSTGYGNFGPKTMAFINTKISSSSTSPSVNSDGTSSNSTSPSNPNDYSVRPAHIINDGAGTSYFANGNDAIVTIQGDNSQQIFFVDQVNKQLVPFSSMQSAMNYFSTVAGRQVSAEEINSSLSQVPSSVLSPGGGLDGFVPVNPVNGFDEQGRLVNPAPSNANIQARYNKPVDQNSEMRAYTALDGFAKLLQNAGLGSTVTPQEITKLISDPTTMSFYINALAYGGYSLQDVYQDMARRQAIDNGQGDKVMNSFPISSAVDAKTYKASDKYKNVQSNPTLNISPSIAGIDSSMLNNPVLSLPDSAFSLISPLSNPDSPEFRAQMEQYKSATYQVALQMSEAANESDHTKALADWKTLKEEIQARLGITLSDNAIQAWNQIDNFTSQAGMANLGGSGMAEQKIDEFLKQQMGVNKSMRSVYASQQDAVKESYYQNYASPTEIAALIASDPQKAKDWGLVPTDAAKAYMTIENLTKLFPGTPGEDLQAIINKHLDPSGNNYSKIYSNYAANKYDIIGKQNLASATDVMQASQNKAADALAQFSDPNNSFLKSGENKFPDPKLPSDGTAVAPKASDSIKAIQAAARNMGSTAAAATPPAAPSTNPATGLAGVNSAFTPTNAAQKAALDALNAAFANPPAAKAIIAPKQAVPNATSAKTGQPVYIPPASMAPVKPASTAPVGVLAPVKKPPVVPKPVAPPPKNDWSLGSFVSTLKKTFGF